jgi:hypothetical protein
MTATSSATVLTSLLALVIAVGLAGTPGCSAPTTPAGGPVTADMERALEEEQKRAHDAEMARQREGAQ